MIDNQSLASPTQSSISIRDYQVHVFHLLKEGWRQLKGVWSILFSSALFVLFIQVIFIDVPEILFEDTHSVLFNLYDSLFFIFVMFPLFAGLMMLGIHHARGEPIKFRQLFDYLKLHFIGKLFTTLVWYIVRVGLPIVTLSIILLLAWNYWSNEKPLWLAALLIPSSILVILFSLYLLIRYMMSIPLVLERAISPWRAMTLAAQAFDHRGFKLSLLFYTQYLISILVVTLICALAILLSVTLFAATASELPSWSTQPERLLDLFSGITGIFIMFLSFLISAVLMPWWLMVCGLVYRDMFSFK